MKYIPQPQTASEMAVWLAASDALADAIEATAPICEDCGCYKSDKVCEDCGGCVVSHGNFCGCEELCTCQEDSWRRDGEDDSVPYWFLPETSMSVYFTKDWHKTGNHNNEAARFTTPEGEFSFCVYNSSSNCKPPMWNASIHGPHGFRAFAVGYGYETTYQDAREWVDSFVEQARLRVMRGETLLVP